MNEHAAENQQLDREATSNVERFIETTFEKLPVDDKVLIALFAALNSAAGLTRSFELPDRLWEKMRFEGCGPLLGQSEEINWLKGVCDGILLIADHV